MKYHNHEIKKVYADLGEEREKDNRVYRIFDKDGNFINEAITLNSAKDYIDNNYDDNYL